MDINESSSKDQTLPVRLTEIVRTSGVAAPAFAIFTATGLVILYLFSAVGLLGQPA